MLRLKLLHGFGLEIAKKQLLQRHFTGGKTFKVNDSCCVSKLITNADIEKFSKISGDANPIHTEQAVVHGAFLNGLVSGVIGTKLPGPGTLVVSQNLNFPNKCFGGETVKITVNVVEDRKIIKVNFVCEVEEQKKVVLHGDAKLVLKARREVLANLSNFAYDPINYGFIRQLGLIDIFLEQLMETDEELLHFSVAAICNLSADPENADCIVKKNGIFLISQQLLHKNVEISLNALSTLIFLITPEIHAVITTPDIINKVLHYQASTNPRMRNLGDVFLKDYCTQEQINQAKISANLNTIDIPLPY